jgi:hypothetical protein
VSEKLHNLFKVRNYFLAWGHLVWLSAIDQPSQSLYKDLGVSFHYQYF